MNMQKKQQEFFEKRRRQVLLQRAGREDVHKTPMSLDISTLTSWTSASMAT